MNGDDWRHGETIGTLKRGQDDLDRRVTYLEEFRLPKVEADVSGMKRLLTSGLAILTAAGATVTFWKAGLIDWWNGK